MHKDVDPVNQYQDPSGNYRLDKLQIEYDTTGSYEVLKTLKDFLKQTLKVQNL